MFRYRSSSKGLGNFGRKKEVQRMLTADQRQQLLRILKERFEKLRIGPGPSNGH